MQQPQQRKMSEEGLKLFAEECDKLIFEIPMDKLGDFDFIASFKAALNAFSPQALRIPPTWYSEMLLSKKTAFRYTDMNIINQILPQATGKAMGLQPRQYAKYIHSVDIIRHEWSLVWNALVEEFENKYAEAPKPEVVEIDTSKVIPLGHA